MCLIVIAISAWLNVFLAVWYPSRHRLSVWFATALLAYDIAQLAMLLYLTGGIDNPFTMLMAAPVTVSAATLPLRNTVALGLMALSATGILVVFHEPLPWYRGLAFELPLIYKFGTFAAVCASTTFLALYAWRLTKEFRQMSAALTATDLVLAREQKLHALDGLAAAAAHELGTPLSTIALVTKELEHALPADSPLREDIGLLRTQALRCREDPAKAHAQPERAGPAARARQRARHAGGGGRTVSFRTDCHLDHRGAVGRAHRASSRRCGGRTPAGRHLRARQYHRECHRLRQGPGGDQRGMELIGSHRQHHRRRSWLPRRGDGQYRRALRHDAACRRLGGR